MSTTKPRITTYTTNENVKKFKIVAAYKNMSVSEYLETIIENAIEQHEKEHGTIKTD